LSQLTSYQKRLFVFLSVATFFEGYDFMALSQILPNLRADMALSEAQGGLLGSVISLGTVLAFVLVRLADRWGRRRVLAITILGYAAFTFLTGLSRAPYDFALYQFIARVFLIAEWALCMVIAAEEYPAEKRGFVIGVIQASNSLGSITCAAIAPFLLQTSPGWRMVYFVGVLPLLLLAYARRGLKETTRYAEYAAARQETRHSLFAILRSPYRTRVLQMALIWGLTYICTNTAVLFWKEFAVGQRGFTDGEVGKAVAIASIGALPFVFFIGKLLDTWGRRRGAVFIYSVRGHRTAGAAEHVYHRTVPHGDAGRRVRVVQQPARQDRLCHRAGDRWLGSGIHGLGERGVAHGHLRDSSADPDPGPAARDLPEGAGGNRAALALVWQEWDGYRGGPQQWR
jgi:putative MFS transporter